MTEEKKNSPRPDAIELPLESPRFDGNANANAQPVEPLRTDSQAGSFRQLITGQSRALALVVIVGFATGALGGIALVKRNEQPPETVQPANESVSELPAVEAKQLDAFGAALDQTASQADRSVRSGKSRFRGRTMSPPRAYRVDVIRD